MSWPEVLILLAAGVLGGVINSVASGGSFFTYPALLFIGLPPIEAATTTLVALTPGNLAAIPEFMPEVKARKHRYPKELTIVIAGSTVGIALLLFTGADLFEGLVPWLILIATALFAVSPKVRTWAETSAPSVTDGFAGAFAVFVASIYMTYFGSGVGNIMLALFTIRGFGDFFHANAAKNIVMTLGTSMAGVAYAFAGLLAWVPMIPILIGSAVGAKFGAKWARHIPMKVLRGLVIAFGLTVAAIQFVK